MLSNLTNHFFCYYNAVSSIYVYTNHELLAVALEKPPEKRKEHVINLERTESEIFAAVPPPPPPPKLPSPPPVEKVTVNPIVRSEKRVSTPPRTGPSTSATSFSVASLQQYTNSFQEQNLIRESRLGKVYLAELPDGKVCIKYCFFYSASDLC